MEAGDPLELSEIALEIQGIADELQRGEKRRRSGGSIVAAVCRAERRD
jgi:hypothetical protein